MSHSLSPGTSKDADLDLPDVNDHALGTVRLDPAEPIVAGTRGQWALHYTVGSYGVDEGGTIKLAQRLACDRERPQFDDPAAPAYTSVTTSGAASLAVRFDPKGHTRPWKACIVIDVYDGFLAPGDTVTITLGDRSHGSPGLRAQTFQESAHEFRLLVDPTNACSVRRVPSSPAVQVVAGPMDHLHCHVPTQGVLGERIRPFIIGHDLWDNPTRQFKTPSLQWEGDPCVKIEDGVLLLTRPGTGRLLVKSGERSCISNALSIHEQPPTYRRLWGDLHAQSDATVGTGTEEEYFRFARDEAGLDFTSHQGNDFQMTDGDWERLNEAVRAFHEDGRFVVLPGYEWSANSPAGGDRNVFYLEEDMPILRSSHWQVPDVAPSVMTPAHPADDLFEKVRKHLDVQKVLLGSHVGGRYADIRRYFDEELGPLVELVSCWGVFEWMLWDAMDCGYVVGVMCNSDGHKGRPGAEGPGAGEFGLSGGLTCVLAEDLTRRAVFEALKLRRCYGTTGARIDLHFEVDGQPMGTILDSSKSHTLEAAVRGQGPIESLLVYCGKRCVQRVRPEAFDDLAASRLVRLSWGGARHRGRGRRVSWNGTIAVAGNEIVSAEPVAFDSAADGIEQINGERLNVRSQTTGDVDGVDLMLASADGGQITFDAAAGRCTFDVAQLSPEGEPTRLDFGGLEIYVQCQRYPEAPMQNRLHLSRTIPGPAKGLTPYFVKAVQVDGQTAWSSPIYLH